MDEEEDDGWNFEGKEEENERKDAPTAPREKAPSPGYQDNVVDLNGINGHPPKMR